MLADGGEKGRAEQGSRQWPSPVPASGPWRAQDPGGTYRGGLLFSPGHRLGYTGEAAVIRLSERGLVEAFPVRACRELGAKLVIGVDVGPRPVPGAPERRNLRNELAERLRTPEECLGEPASLLEFPELKLKPWPRDILVRPEFPWQSRGAISARIRVPRSIFPGERCMEAELPALFSRVRKGGDG